MPCNLRFNNSKGEGGKYDGKSDDKPAFMYRILLKLCDDGYKFGEPSTPLITITPTEGFEKKVRGGIMNPTDLLGEDVIDYLYCTGLDETEKCDGCRYFQKDLRKEYPNVSDIPITELEFSIKTGHLLENVEQIRTLGDLANQTEAALIATYKMPGTSLCEIKRLLNEYGLGLRAEQ